MHSHRDPIGRYHFYPSYFRNEKIELNKIEGPSQHYLVDMGQSRSSNNFCVQIGKENKEKMHRRLSVKMAGKWGT